MENAMVTSGVTATADLMRVDEGEITFHHNGHNPLAVRKWITDLKDRLLSMPGEQREMPVTHEFVDGMYVRRLFIAKGTILVGKIHKKACVNVVERGDISVLTETGSKRIQAGFTLISPAGLQKVGFAHEDTVFTNIFRTDETDLAKIEEEIIAKDYDELSLNAPDETLTLEGSL